MAYIRKNNSRKNIAVGTPFTNARWRTEDGGVTLVIQVEHHQLILSQLEAEMLMEKWPSQIKEMER